jgi:hypothetical protein
MMPEGDPELEDDALPEDMASDSDEIKSGEDDED